GHAHCEPDDRERAGDRVAAADERRGSPARSATPLLELVLTDPCLGAVVEMEYLLVPRPWCDAARSVRLRCRGHRLRHISGRRSRGAHIVRRPGCTGCDGLAVVGMLRLPLFGPRLL